MRLKYNYVLCSLMLDAQFCVNYYTCSDKEEAVLPVGAIKLAQSAKPSVCHKTLVNRLVRVRRCVSCVL